MLKEWEIQVLLKMVNSGDTEDTHVFQWGYWHEQAQKKFLNISEKYNYVIPVLRHENSCNWTRTT